MCIRRDKTLALSSMGYDSESKSRNTENDRKHPIILENITVIVEIKKET